MTHLAYGYLNGTGGLPRNIAEGVKWIRAAVQAEDLEAASWLAGWYENGERGLAQDRAAATAVWTQLARSTDPETARGAVNHLGQQERDRQFREMQEQQNKTAWDFWPKCSKLRPCFQSRKSPVRRFPDLAAPLSGHAIQCARLTRPFRLRVRLVVVQQKSRTAMMCLGRSGRFTIPGAS